MDAEKTAGIRIEEHKAAFGAILVQIDVEAVVFTLFVTRRWRQPGSGNRFTESGNQFPLPTISRSFPRLASAGASAPQNPAVVSSSTRDALQPLAAPAEARGVSGDLHPPPRPGLTTGS